MRILLITCLAVASLTSCAGQPSIAPSPGVSEPIPPSASATPRDWQSDLWSQLVASQYPGAGRPDANFIRYVDTSEIAQVMADCLGEAGFEVTPTPDGGVVADAIPPAQDEAYATATYVCMVEYPLDPKYSVPLDDSRLQVLFTYYVDKAIPCLEAEGYAVEDVPSFRTFADTVATTGWSPLSEVLGTFRGSQAEWYRLQEACPSYPDGFYD